MQDRVRLVDPSHRDQRPGPGQLDLDAPARSLCGAMSRAAEYHDAAWPGAWPASWSAAAASVRAASTSPRGLATARWRARSARGAPRRASSAAAAWCARKRDGGRLGVVHGTGQQRMPELPSAGATIGRWCAPTGRRGRRARRSSTSRPPARPGPGRPCRRRRPRCRRPAGSAGSRAPSSSASTLRTAAGSQSPSREPEHDVGGPGVDGLDEERVATTGA